MYFIRISPREFSKDLAPCNRSPTRRSSPDLLDLDCSVAGPGATLGPGQSRLTIRYIHDVETAQLLLGIRVRSIQHARIPVGRSNGRSRSTRIQPTTALEHTGLLHGF